MRWFVFWALVVIELLCALLAIGMAGLAAAALVDGDQAGFDRHAIDGIFCLCIAWLADCAFDKLDQRGDA